MSENNGASAIDVTLAFLMGGVLGAGLTLLFAPASGRELRKKFRDTGERLRDSVRETTDEWRGTVTEGVGRATEGVKSFVVDKKTRGQAAIVAAKEAWQQ